MPAVLAGIIGIAINYGTYISEVIRSAIVSIDNGQTEAALALVALHNGEKRESLIAAVVVH